MAQHIQAFFGNTRFRNHVDRLNSEVRAKRGRRGNRSSKRARGVPRDEQLPFVPPEDWHEPRANRPGYRVIAQRPGVGYRHVLTPSEIRDRLAQLPDHFVEPLEVVQLSRMTRKKQGFPCYGMQWGAAIYLYPVEESLIEYFTSPPKPSQIIEARMYGGQWEQDRCEWRLIWSEQAIKDFYLNNILIHELAHVLDQKNTAPADRERYAEWFALEYGYKPTRPRRSPRETVRRHHAPNRPR